MRRIKYSEVRKVVPNFFEYTGHYTDVPVCMQLFVFDKEGYEEYDHVSLQKIKKEVYDPAQSNDVKWLNIHGLHDVELVKKVGETLEIDPQIIGDVLNTARRSRMEELDDVLFFSIKSILLRTEPKETLDVDQVSFLLRGNLIVSFQEKRSDFFAHIRERIRTGSGIVRKKGADYLLYLLLDAIMENFYITIESYEDRIETLLAQSKTDRHNDVQQRIEKDRESLNFLKRSILPLRDALYALKDSGEERNIGISPSNYAFFARIHQKSLEILEQLEYDMNSLESASNIFFSTQNQRMNEIMKTLTIFSGIFMPLTFIVGVYGMNFDYMPELRAHNGYFITLAAMGFIAIALAVYFKVKRWF